MSSEQTGYAWGTAGSEIEAFHDAATKLNEVIASKGFVMQEPAAEDDVLEVLKSPLSILNDPKKVKTFISELLDGEDILDFSSFEDFKVWLDALLEYDRRDNEDTPGGDEIGSEDCLRQAYLDLCNEARANANSKPGMRLG
ncbi:hypothetical protein AX279_16820 [Pseudomonas sp. J237]|nr:hypothetical protein AX279_16820 [Pseudomonas sp. J237]